MSGGRVMDGGSEEGRRAEKREVVSNRGSEVIEVPEETVGETGGGQHELWEVHDSPLEHPNEDRMGLAPLAWRLAHTILAEPSDKSVVYAIYGGWGTGKSTALNFVRWFLREATGQLPNGKGQWDGAGLTQDEMEALRKQRRVGDVVIVRFDPWWYEREADVVFALFAEMFGQTDRCKHQKLVGMGTRFLAALLKAGGGAAQCVVPGGSLLKETTDLIAEAIEPRQLSLYEARRQLAEALRDWGGIRGRRGTEETPDGCTDR